MNKKELLKCLDEFSDNTEFELKSDFSLSKVKITEMKLKPFNLEAAKAGEPIVTRDGRNVEFIGVSTQFKDHPIVCNVEGNSSYSAYTLEGKYNFKDEIYYDLFMKPKEVVKWVI